MTHIAIGEQMLDLISKNKLAEAADLLLGTPLAEEGSAFVKKLKDVKRQQILGLLTTADFQSQQFDLSKELVVLARKLQEI